MARKANWCERYLGSDHHTDRFVGSIVKYENKSGIDFHHLPKDYYTAHCPRNVKQLVVEAEEDGPRRHLLSQVRAFKAGYSEAPSRSSSPRPARRFSVDYGVLARRPRSRAVSPAPLGRDYRSVTPSCSRPDSLPPASRVNSARSSVARDSGPQDFESTPYKPVLEERPRASVPRAPSLQRSIPKMGRYRSASFSAGSGYSPEYSVVRTGMTKGYDDMPSPAYAIHRAAAISRYTQDDAADLASRSRRADREFLDAVTRRIHEREMESIKPSFDVASKCGFRKNIYGKIRARKGKEALRERKEREAIGEKSERRMDELRYPWNYALNSVFREARQKARGFGYDQKEEPTSRRQITYKTREITESGDDSGQNNQVYDYAFRQFAPESSQYSTARGREGVKYDSSGVLDGSISRRMTTSKARPRPLSDVSYGISYTKLADMFHNPRIYENISGPSSKQIRSYVRSATSLI